MQEITQVSDGVTLSGVLVTIRNCINLDTPEKFIVWMPKGQGLG